MGGAREDDWTKIIEQAQRFGFALNLNIHFHMLFLDGVYVDRLDGSVRFRWVNSPTSQELTRLMQIIARRVGRSLGGFVRPPLSCRFQQLIES